jgi:hypothetical protein
MRLYNGDGSNLNPGENYQTMSFSGKKYEKGREKRRKCKIKRKKGARKRRKEKEKMGSKRVKYMQNREE